MAGNPRNDPIIQMLDALYEGGKDDTLFQNLLRGALCLLLLPVAVAYAMLWEVFEGMRKK